MMPFSRKLQDPALGRFLQAHFALCFIPACVMSEDRTVVWWNRHAEDAVGIAEKEVIGRAEGMRVFLDPRARDIMDRLSARPRERERESSRLCLPEAMLLSRTDSECAVCLAPPPEKSEAFPTLLLYGRGTDEKEGRTFTYYAWAGFPSYDFVRSPSLDLFRLLNCLDRNGDAWFGVNQNELNLYLSRPLIDEIYSSSTLQEELMGTSVFLSMEDAAARDHERTINSLTEASSAHTVLHWPQRTREGKKVWTQSWPNIIRVNGKKANFSLVRDITAEKERDFLLEGVFAAQRKERHQSYQELLTMFAGRSAVMGQTMENLLRAALSLVTVSIYGETGTGKSLAARLVHQLSSKADGPFTYVNCSAIPDELFESSFFGHVKGAFTGAIRDAEGFLTKADQGTLFLDEIAELSPRAQSKLLQALSDKTYTPVGSTRELLSNFRLIVATNRNLEDMVRAGTFREDLFYRVNVLDVTLPPLRMRKDDIPLLVNAILRRNGISFTPSSTVLKKLYTHSWPGNIRELENVIMRYAAERSLEFFHPVPVKGREETRTPGMPEEREDVPLKEQLARAEKNAIAQALQKNCWNRQRTADALGITRITLFRKMREHGISDKHA